MKELTTSQKQQIWGAGAPKKSAAKKPAGGNSKGMVTGLLIMLIPSLITAVVEGGIAIKNAVSPSESASPSFSRSYSSPRPTIRMSPILSRSTVSYGLPSYYA